MELNPGYKQTEAGALPESWRAIRLHQCVRANAPICYGILMPGEHYDHGVPVIKVRDILRGRINESDLLFTHPSIDDAYKRSRLCGGDLLITIRGTTGRVALVQKNLNGANITQDTARVRISPAESERFVYYALQSQAVQQQVALHTIGQAVKGINIRDVKDLSIPLPARRSEQDAIAGALSDVDALIESLERLIAKKHQIKQGAMQELLTGERRLPGFARTVSKTTEIGFLPDEWSVLEIGQLADVKTGPFGSSLHERDYVDDGTPIITVEHLGDNGITHSNLPMVSESDRKRLIAYSLEEGDIVFSRVGSVDRNARISEKEAGWLFSGRLLRVRAASSKSIDTRFLSYQFHSHGFKERVKKVAVGQTMASLNTQILRGVLIAVPSSDEQAAIADVLSAMDRDIAGAETTLVKALDLKQAMMQALLTGRIRLV